MILLYFIVYALEVIYIYVICLAEILLTGLYPNPKFLRPLKLSLSVLSVW